MPLAGRAPRDWPLAGAASRDPWPAAAATTCAASSWGGLARAAHRSRWVRARTGPAKDPGMSGPTWTRCFPVAPAAVGLLSSSRPPSSPSTRRIRSAGASSSSAHRPRWSGSWVAIAARPPRRRSRGRHSTPASSGRPGPPPSPPRDWPSSFRWGAGDGRVSNGVALMCMAGVWCAVLFFHGLDGLSAAPTPRDVEPERPEGPRRKDGVRTGFEEPLRRRFLLPNIVCGRRAAGVPVPVPLPTEG